MVVCPVLYTGKYLDTSHESKMEKNFLQLVSYKYSFHV